mmetsp:Transcript_60166/g.164850  ORF Transcript_60166/g.164850 Transcript_60166/m.164850 type:complete len:87 (+) Transcript_60166:384-644(+)
MRESRSAAACAKGGLTRASAHIVQPERCILMDDEPHKVRAVHERGTPAQGKPHAMENRKVSSTLKPIGRFASTAKVGRRMGHAFIL